MTEIIRLLMETSSGHQSLKETGTIIDHATEFENSYVDVSYIEENLPGSLPMLTDISADKDARPQKKSERKLTDVDRHSSRQRCKTFKESQKKSHIEEKLPGSSPMLTDIAADKDARPLKKVRKKGHQSLKETGTIIDHATEFENSYVDVSYIEENLPGSLPMLTDISADKDARPQKKSERKTDIAADKDARPLKKVRKKGHQSLKETGTIIDHTTEFENCSVDVSHIEEKLPGSSPMLTDIAADKDARPLKKVRKKGHQSLKETGTIIDHATEFENCSVDVSHILETLPGSSPMQTDIAADRDARPLKKVRKEGHQSLKETGTIIDHATEFENCSVDVSHILETLPGSSPMQTDIAADRDARPLKKVRKKGHQSLKETGTIIDHATEFKNCSVDVSHIEENLPGSSPMETDIAADKDTRPLRKVRKKGHQSLKETGSSPMLTDVAADRDARPLKKVRKKGHQSLKETGTIIDHATEFKNCSVDVSHIEENLPGSSPMETDIAADKDARPLRKVRKKGMTIKTKHRKYLPLATRQPSISGTGS
ncbi:unnamed protein product [Mytilus coruscus]|uniref:Uncharacterized protein n=1 Tax=Mytilus coruscus TaxID=42192 RepID=A0A6J8CVK2_MYTCO|nr:unnamed protein product [Mytilus coruscus]